MYKRRSLSSLSLSVLWMFILWMSTTAMSYGQTAVDPRLPVYRPVNDLQGELKLAGSNTMSHVASAWANSFRRFYPEVKISIDIRGSRGAVSSVHQGEAHLGLLSRTIKPQEVENFQKVFGYQPTVVTPCFEQLAIYVHKDNPIEGLTLPQVDAIFSSSLKRGEKKPIRTWGELGLSKSWASRSVVAHGRTADTGSQVFIRDFILLGGTFRDDLQGHRNNLGMVKTIAADPSSIGFAGLSYQMPGVRAVPLAMQNGAPFVSVDSGLDKGERYPLIRPLQLVVNHNPEQELRPIEKEFIRFAFSQLGQEDVIKAGYQATDVQTAYGSLDMVGLSPIR